MADGVQIRWDGLGAKAAVRRGARRGVERAAELVADRSLDVVPRETEHLARSLEVSAEDLVAAVSYDTPYAVAQHERTRLHHARGETAKYLENPLNASRSDVSRVIAAEINRETT